MQTRPVLFGEVLFDCFPDRSRVLGGAPFNVAWHLRGFGLEPLLIGRIGDDAAGREVLDAMTDWGLDTSGIQIDPGHPTGQVQVRIEAGQPVFDILADQAYDHIDAAPALDAIGRAGGARLLYHGTLALRSEDSRETFATLSRRLACPRCLDVNLRPPWTGPELVGPMLDGADWAKLNDHELREIAGWTGSATGDLSDLARQVRDDRRIGRLIVTCGAEGAMLLDDDGVRSGRPVPVDEIVDTVGAGDAFSAVALLGLAGGWPAGRILAAALEFASIVCGRRGATIAERTVYEDCLDRWRSWGDGS